MDPQIQHDPQTKNHIKEALYVHLYAPVQQHFQGRLDKLIVQNTLLIRSTHKSFVYKGEYYSCDNTPPPRPNNKLAPELRGQMNDYLAELHLLNSVEVPYVVGYITQVLNSSNDLCDYIDLLPNSLHSPIQRFIAACPCKTRHLSPEEVKAIQEKNAKSINLMKTRMATNLLLT